MNLSENLRADDCNLFGRLNISHELKRLKNRLQLVSGFGSGVFAPAARYSTQISLSKHGGLKTTQGPVYSFPRIDVAGKLSCARLWRQN